MTISDVFDQGRIAAGGLADFARGFGTPTVRLGVTGLARSGKTVFITALVHALLQGARMPAFTAHAQGRIARVYLEPQPDDHVPRFAYEAHLAAIGGPERRWPEGTRGISQLRLTFDYEPRGLIARSFGSGRLHLDIVDYPGEWVLDLPLMNQSYAQWSNATIAASRNPPRAVLAAAWHAHLSSLDANAPADEAQAVAAAELFTAYLARCRQSDVSLSTLPPGRFLMPGEYAGSPLLSFAPLDVAPDAQPQRGTLASLMERRYHSYVTTIVRPFFFNHFARLDRQIVLADVLSALNAGPTAVQDLRSALEGVLACYRQGANGIVSALFGRRIDRILFAATKADLLHHVSHDRLEAILKLLVQDASARAAFSGAAVGSAAVAAIRATREATVKHKGEDLPCIAGTPEAGATIGKQRFDGTAEAAIFPGDLPENAAEALEHGLEAQVEFVNFRPPLAVNGAFPHIRLDRALEFLIGDRFA